MGAAGDMLASALLELLPDRCSFLAKLNSLGLPGVQFSTQRAEKCGVVGTHFSVKIHGEEEISQDVSLHETDSEAYSHNHNHAHDPLSHGHDHSHSHTHHSLPRILALLDGLSLPEKVREDAKAVYRLLGDAESRVHGTPMEEIHFHEVGTMDAVGDIVAVCLLFHEIAPEEVLASPVHVGSGSVHCAHGILPVPTPATALLLQGIPFCGGPVSGELCTPTGAALLRYFVSRFEEKPIMTVETIGYGLGQKDFEQANCLRAFLGTTEARRGKITRLECNLDDMTGEDIGFAVQRLFSSGALDVFTQPVGMKKSRPGVLLSVLCSLEDADRLASVMMQHTTTLGVRRQDMSRYVLDRRIEQKQTSLGEVRLKYASGLGVERKKIEYEDLASLAEQHHLPVSEIRETIEQELSQKLLSFN